MRLFGILLIFANLIAGGAFVYFATQDWKHRQQITAAGVRHILLLQGLPLEGEGFSADDETRFVVEMGGGESTKTISKKLLESYFRDNTAAAPPAPAVGAEPAPASAVSLTKDAQVVTNQIAEVERVQKLIKAELAKDGLAPEGKLTLLKGWLLYQAENFNTRTTYLALLAPTDANGQNKSDEQKKADAAKLEELLDARFAVVIAKPQAADGPASAAPAEGAAPLSDKDKVEKSAAWKTSTVLNEGDRRMRLAHLLVHLDPDPVWQKRVSVVVGLRRYAQAISRQVLAFGDMIKHVELGIPDDQAAFVKQELLFRELATQNSERARAVAEKRLKRVEQKAAADDQVNRESTQLKAVTEQLAKIKAEVDELLVRQSGIEKQLFEIQREVSLTLEEVYRLEELLDATERERFGLPPRPRP